jgi:hypothetical protein
VSFLSVLPAMMKRKTPAMTGGFRFIPHFPPASPFQRCETGYMAALGPTRVRTCWGVAKR